MRWIGRRCLIAGLALVACASAGEAWAQTGPPYTAGADEDADGVPNEADLCILVPDPAQRDTDGDGVGDPCDCDFNDDTVCNLEDFPLLLADLIAGVPGSGAWTDMDGDGAVNLADFMLFLPGLLAGFPGPSAPPVLGVEVLQQRIAAAGPGGVVRIDELFELCRSVRPLAGQTWEGEGRLRRCPVPRTHLTEAALAGETRVVVDDPTVFPVGEGHILGFGLGGLVTGSQAAPRIGRKRRMPTGSRSPPASARTTRWARRSTRPSISWRYSSPG